MLLSRIKWQSESGSAATEFVFLAAPMVLVALTTIAIGLSSFTLMIMRDSAIEAARFAALADQDSAAGCARAQTLISTTMVGALKPQIDCYTPDGEIEIIVVKASFQLFGILPGVQVLSATGRAPREY